MNFQHSDHFIVLNSNDAIYPKGEIINFPAHRKVESDQGATLPIHLASRLQGFAFAEDSYGKGLPFSLEAKTFATLSTILPLQLTTFNWCLTLSPNEELLKHLKEGKQLPQGTIQPTSIQSYHNGLKANLTENKSIQTNEFPTLNQKNQWVLKGQAKLHHQIESFYSFAVYARLPHVKLISWAISATL